VSSSSPVIGIFANTTTCNLCIRRQIPGPARKLPVKLAVFVVHGGCDASAGQVFASFLSLVTFNRFLPGSGQPERYQEDQSSIRRAQKHGTANVLLELPNRLGAYSPTTTHLSCLLATPVDMQQSICLLESSAYKLLDSMIGILSHH